MNTKDEALKMAIETLEAFEITGYCDETIQACKEALEQPSVTELNDEYLRDTHVDGLEQPAQEPVAWMCTDNYDEVVFLSDKTCIKCQPIYTHPAPSWQGLSFDEINSIIKELSGYDTDADNYNVAVFVEEALKNKNANNA